QAIGQTKLETIVGPVEWGQKNLPPFAQKNIAKTPLVGGQWRLREASQYDIVITDNKTAPQIPVAAQMNPITCQLSQPTRRYGQPDLAALCGGETRGGNQREDPTVIEEISRRRAYNAVSDFVDINIARGLGHKVAFTDRERSITYAELQRQIYQF